MIVIHSSRELLENKERIPSSVYNFLVQQFSFLEDSDPQMNVYGNPDFLCSTGMIGVIFSMDELKDLNILDELESADGIKIFTCLDGAVPLDVVFSFPLDNEDLAFLADYRKLSIEEKESIQLIIKNYLKKSNEVLL